jgi:hypothetical protein
MAAEKKGEGLAGRNKIDTKATRTMRMQRVQIIHRRLQILDCAFRRNQPRLVDIWQLLHPRRLLLKGQELLGHVSAKEESDCAIE